MSILTNCYIIKNGRRRHLFAHERILLAMLAYANDREWCVSVQHIADLCRLSFSTVQSTLRKLKAQGLITAELRCDERLGQLPSAYRITPTGSAQATETLKKIIR